MPLLDELRQELRGFICLSGPWSSSDRTRALFPLAHSRLLSHTGLVLKQCMQAACPAGTASLEDCWFLHSFSSHHIYPEFSLIVSYLKSLPPQKSAWAPSCGPGAVHRGTRTTVGTVCCQWAQYSSSPGPWYGPVCCWMHYRQHWLFLCCVYNTPSPRRSSPHPASRPATSCYLPTQLSKAAQYV